MRDEFDEPLTGDLVPLAGTEQVAEATIAGGGTMLQVRGSYATAVSVQKPRVPSAVDSRLRQEAQLAGESFYYGWGAGRDRIEGPSVGLAMAAARCWGNCAIEQLPVQETSTAWIFTCAFVDLETGFTATRQFRQSKKWTVHGKHDPERKDDIRFQIGQSKAARNVILNSLPEYMIDRAMDAAKAGVREKIEKYVAAKGIAAAIEMMLTSLAKVGVVEQHILAKCGVAKAEAIDIDHLVILRGDLSAIQEGKEFANVLFPTLAEDKPQPPVAPKGAAGASAKLDEKASAADIEAKMKAEYQTAKTQTEASGVRDKQCGPEGWLSTDEQRRRSQEMYEVRCAELRCS